MFSFPVPNPNGSEALSDLLHADLSKFHQPIGKLFPFPGSKTDWDAFRLSNEQVAFFHEQGYLKGIRILDDRQLEVFRGELAEFFQPDHAGQEFWYEYHTNESPDPATVLFHALGAWRLRPGFHDLFWNPAFTLPASQLLGGAVRFWHDQLFCKPPRSWRGGRLASGLFLLDTHQADGPFDVLDRAGRQHARKWLPAVCSGQPPLGAVADHRAGRRHERNSDGSRRRTKGAV